MSRGVGGCETFHAGVRGRKCEGRKADGRVAGGRAGEYEAGDEGCDGCDGCEAERKEYGEGVRRTAMEG
eukprot:747112-Hanusia_phi.AAC.6